MTIDQATLSPAHATQPRGNIWRLELIDTVRLAVPIALTQLGQIAMMTTDLLLLGRLGDDVIAATALAHAMLTITFTLGMGLVAAVAPLAAQAYGARDPRGVRRALRAGLWAVVLIGVPLSILQLWGNDILVALGQPPATAELSQRYLTSLTWSLVPAWTFVALRGFMGAVNRPEPALWITLVAIPVNAILAYALINGVFGLPRLDILGAGLATTIVSTAMCVAAVWVCYAAHPFKKYQILGRFWRPDWTRFRRLLVIGSPISVIYALEMGVFSAAALLMGLFGTSAIAAHQIAIQIASILFMVPFGIAMAATVRVGHAVGRGDGGAARRAGFVALGLGVVFMASMTALVAATRDLIPYLFLGAASPDQQATITLAATLLLLGMSFFIADGVQTVAAGALRGLNDTAAPMLIAIVSYWVIGFPLCWLFGFTAGLGPVGVWIGLSIALCLQALALVARFHLLTRGGIVAAV